MRRAVLVPSAELLELLVLFELVSYDYIINKYIYCQILKCEYCVPDDAKKYMP